MTAADIGRASPDALLAVAQKEHRGRLKIFVGAAPGVGKTYAMLAAAQSAKREGRDVVVGLVETHGRAETAAFLADLPVLPRKPIAYRNRIEQEFDLDGALERHPEVLVVDEFAHSNAPGSRHPKRWQDIQELREAGIEVWTTLNIQHLESLNDVIQKITRVRVRETVPDVAFEEADEIVLVDLPPEELLKRLAEGKVYVRDTATRALANFFQPQNLAALRELALRRAAERVDSDLVERMQAQAIAGPWPAGERILACIGPDPGSPGVVRAAKRLADRMDAPWITVTVERPGEGATSGSRRQVAEVLRLAETLGAETKTLVGNDIPGEVIRFARFENVTQIVIGRSHSGFISEVLRRSLPHELVRRATDIAVHVVTQAEARPERQPFRVGPLPPFRLEPFLWSTATVALAGLVGQGLTLLTPFPNLSIVFLLAVLVSALRLGIGAAIYASALSFLVYNFFFIDPLYTFTIAQPYELLALVIFLIVAVLTSAAAGQVRNQAKAAAERTRTTRRLYEFTRRLSGLATIDGVAEGAVGEINASLGRATVVLLPREGQLTLCAAWPPEDQLDPAAMTAARWALSHNESAGSGTDTLPTVRWQFEPLRTPRGTLGVVGIAASDDKGPLDPEARALFDTLAEQTAAALDRASLASEIAGARSAAETERVRNTLLASISHDFRTPLSSILGSATSLIEYGAKMNEPQQADLLRQIKEEAEGLDGMVRDLLAIARIDAGALELRRDWIDLREIVERVISSAKRRYAAHRLAVEWPDGLPLVRADPLLSEQAVGNVVANALAHTPAGTNVRIDANAVAGVLRVSITDDGPGIAPDLLPHIFDKFVRSATPKQARADGGDSVGLGLAIARGIMEAHGGTIAAESPVASGRGTRISLGFPLEERER